MEAHKSNENSSPLNLVKCLGELAMMYAQEKLRAFVDMIDDAEDVWGDDGADGRTE